jgi:hypothetical protein
MGALFSTYGIAAGNSEVVSQVPSFVLDVILIPAVGIVFVYDVMRLIGATDKFNTGDKVFILCLVLVFLLLLLWVVAWTTGKLQIVIISPKILQRLSRMVVKQAERVMVADNALARRHTTDAAAAAAKANRA